MDRNFLEKNSLFFVGLVALFCLPTSAMGADFVSLLMHLANNMKQIYIALIALSYILGIWFTISGIFGFKEYGLRSTFMQPQKGMIKPLFKFMIGTAFIFMPDALDVMLETLWGIDTSSVKVYLGDSVSARWNDILQPLVVVVQVVGLVAIIRGLVSLTKLGQQNVQHNMVSKALIHIVGGAACINIVGTIDIIEGTLGF